MVTHYRTLRKESHSMNLRQKIATALSYIYGVGVMIALFVGGLTFFGYVAALIIGGETATEICVFIYKTIYPILFYFSSGVALLGLLKMYIAREKSMAPTKRNKQNKAENK